MDVKLYVYDLSQGLCRMLSKDMLGIQVDGVWHTSIVLNNVEYFYGAGIQTAYPGKTHHGQPMQILPLGTTQLPMEVIKDYLHDMREHYSHASYDLFLKNCNNFSNDFSEFLVGKGIPEHITTMPQQVLATPLGSMLLPQLESAMKEVTQAPVPPQNDPMSHGAEEVPDLD